MQIQVMREALKRANGSRKWTIKVSRMSDEKVIDIYQNLRLQRKV